MKSKPIRLLLVDDHSMVRMGFAALLGAEQGFEIAAEAEDLPMALQAYREILPDVVLMDVRMPGLGGVEASRRLVATYPDAAVMMLTMAEDTDGVARAVAGGSRGYLVKDATREELTATVSYALAEATWRRAPRQARPDDLGTPPSLTERELQVLTGMSRGRSNAEIGRELYLSEDTVKTHARRLFRKVGASDRAHAVALGFRWGLVR